MTGPAFRSAVGTDVMGARRRQVQLRPDVGDAARPTDRTEHRCHAHRRSAAAPAARRASWDARTATHTRLRPTHVRAARRVATAVTTAPSARIGSRTSRPAVSPAGDAVSSSRSARRGISATTTMTAPSPAALSIGDGAIVQRVAGVAPATSETRSHHRADGDGRNPSPTPQRVDRYGLPILVCTVPEILRDTCPIRLSDRVTIKRFALRVPESASR